MERGAGRWAWCAMCGAKCRATLENALNLVVPQTGQQGQQGVPSGGADDSPFIPLDI